MLKKVLIQPHTILTICPCLTVMPQNNSDDDNGNSNANHYGEQSGCAYVWTSGPSTVLHIYLIN